MRSHPSLHQIYKKAKYFSMKHDSYFSVYEELFSAYVDQDITFVEIGVLNGGSLMMWREFFGPKATIIGIDLNPAAKELEKDGFKIFIGSQSDPLFWDNFFAQVGAVDIVLDDGGHTNRQQIITTDKCIPYIKDGGKLVIEDAHTSYFPEFGNPSQFSFINFAKRLVDSVNSRFPAVNVVKNTYGQQVYSVSFYESIVSFSIDRKKCFVSKPVTNDGITANNKDFRYKGTIQEFFYRAKRVLNYVPLLNLLTNRVFDFLIHYSFRKEASQVKKYFR